MGTSQNGWPASRDPSSISVKPFTVAGRSFPGGVKAGSVATVLRYVASQYHLRVESLYYGSTDKDDWGYSYRRIGGSSVLSNHSSGTAIDVNATTNAQGSGFSHTYAQVKVIRAILREVGGVVVWGGDFRHSDPMHFEIKGSGAAVKAVAARLVSPPWYRHELYVNGSDPAKWFRGEDVKVVQRRLGFTGTAVDGVYGPVTRDAVKQAQRRLALTVSGRVGKGMAFFIGTSA